MVTYTICYSKIAVKDIENLRAAKLDKKARALIEMLRVNPFQNPPTFEKLIGNLCGLCSRRINARHRLVYEVFEAEKTVRIERMWTHYEGFAD